MSQRVTLEDIAAKSGASPATVSLALRNKPGVSRSTRERIQAVARSLGYTRPSSNGREEQGVRNVALIFRTPGFGPERSAPALNRFYSWILSGIQEAADDLQVNLVLGTIPVDEANQPVELPPARLLDSARDGVVLVGAFRNETLRDVITAFGAHVPPIVLVDGHGDEFGLDSVGSRNQEGTYTATRYLIDRGHTEIAFAGPILGSDPNFDARCQGYQEAMLQSDLECHRIDVEEEGIHLPESQSGAFPYTGLVCGNDYGAWLLSRELQRRGIRVPDDVSIVGFDDTDHARDAIPPLTTMAVDTLTMGRLGVAMLDFRLRFPEAAQLTALLQPRLVERSSVRDLRGKQ